MIQIREFIDMAGRSMIRFTTRTINGAWIITTGRTSEREDVLVAHKKAIASFEDKLFAKGSGS